MNTIRIRVVQNVAKKEGSGEYVCGNSAYQVEFSFDAAWDSYREKTARFQYRDSRGKKEVYQDVVFQGNVCPVPVILDASVIRVGVFAGNLHTTTTAAISARKSALCGAGSPVAPTEDVYAQIMELLNQKGVGEGIPAGGQKGQVLRKQSDKDYDVIWSDVAVSEQYGLVTYDQDRRITIT